MKTSIGISQPRAGAMTNDEDSADQVNHERVTKHAYCIVYSMTLYRHIVKQSYSDLSLIHVYACASQRTRYTLRHRFRDVCCYRSKSIFFVIDKTAIPRIAAGRGAWYLTLCVFTHVVYARKASVCSVSICQY